MREQPRICADGPPLPHRDLSGSARTCVIWRPPDAVTVIVADLPDRFMQHNDRD